MRVQLNARNRAYEFNALPGEKILYAGLRSGAGLPYECGTGTCGTCKARLIEGRIDDGWPAAPGKKTLKAERAEFLMCQCSPASDVALEVASFVYPLDTNTCPVAVHAGTIEKVRALTHDVSTVDIALKTPCEFDAGQFMSVAARDVPGMRGYSMVNFEQPAKRLEFVIKKKPGGGFSEWLASGRATGASIELVGPLGRATFVPGLAKNLLCIAGGSGIAGMMAILSRASRERHFERHQGHVFFGVRTMKDAFYLEELSALRRQFPRSLEITVALSDDDVPRSAAERWPELRFAHGLVHEVARREMAGKYQNTRAYVAGPPPAVDAAIRVLVLDGKLTADNIRYDKYS
ncbi:MAG: 2Fe-2S iron-sulfur cluster-binding protein [Burkholderiales bacterium]